ncbi:MAG: ribonuclease P protein component [Bacteroidetes bacterium]|nr:ribonuclease P protein component [Bacteroidota bacterium]
MTSSASNKKNEGHSSRSQRFYQAERLTSQALIGRLFLDGSSIPAFPIRLIWLPAALTGPFPVQVLFAVPSSKFKRAVDRNRIRRQLRECWRLRKGAVYRQLGPSPKTLAVALLYSGRRMPTYAELGTALDVALRKLLHELEHSHPADKPGPELGPDGVDPVLPGRD